MDCSLDLNTNIDKLFTIKVIKVYIEEKALSTKMFASLRDWWSVVGLSIIDRIL